LKNLASRVRLRPTLGLLAIALISVILFSFRLDFQSLWYDEGFSVYLSRMTLGEITARTAADIHPPLYYYLLHFWMGLFGSSEVALRSLSVVFAVLTVPVVYGIGLKLFGRPGALLSALLIAISPLFLWYAQEARMYTLVTFLTALSSWLLLILLSRQPGRGSARARSLLWAGYALANALAIYAHFYAFFIIAFQAIFVLIWWATNDRTLRTLAPWIISLICIGGCYLPWSQFVVGRYGADVSYWEGTLQVQEVLRKTLLLFSTGHSVLEQTAQPLALGYLAALAAGLLVIALGWTGSKPHESRRVAWQNWLRAVFLVLYMVVPIALLLAVSYQRPKFHPRYLMIASPAFFLMLGGAVAGLRAWGQRAQAASRRAAAVAAYLTASIILIFVLITSLYGVYNVYFDARFTKDDFRGAARYILSHQSEQEGVILVSGHFFPVFTYYYPQDNWHPIPAQATLDAEQVLGFDVAQDLNRAVPPYRGIWLLLWQDEVVDPNGFVTMMLGTEGEEIPVHASFWGLRLKRYQIPDDVHFSSEPDFDRQVRVNFDNKIQLLGYSQVKGQGKGDIRVILFWEALQPLSEDYKLSLRLQDGDGHFWGRLDRRPASYWYPTTRWQPGQALFGDCVLVPDIGTPPGEYELAIGLYTEENPAGLDILDVAGAPMGKTQVIGKVVLTEPPQPASVEELRIANILNVDFGETVRLLGGQVGRDSAQPGDPLEVTLFWQAPGPSPEDVQLNLQLVDENGHLAGHQLYDVAGPQHPPDRWRTGEILKGQYRFTIPVDASPGRAQIQIGLRDEKGNPIGTSVSLASIQVGATTRVFTVPEVQYGSDANLGDVVTLIGADLDKETLEPGETLHLTLFWQARANMEVSYTVFTHVLDASNQIWAQQDSVPAEGERPTTGWVPQEVIQDDYDLVIKPDAPPGEYVLEVGMYDASQPGFPRLPVLNEAGEQVGDRILLGQITVIQ